MTPTQRNLIRATWKQIAPIRNDAATLFYRKLFELNPLLQSLFDQDLTEQKRQLMTMIENVVNGLDRFETFAPALRSLGQRHEHYGVRAGDYDTVESALLWTLERGLGEGFTLEVRHAWSTAYGAIAQSMQSRAESNVA